MYGSIPGSLPNKRAYRERFVPDRVSATRGCNMPYPSETRCIRSSYRGTVQRVRHGPDELPRRVARQLRIRVEGDHEPDVRQILRPADDDGKAIRRPAPEEQVQLRKLSPLAFVSHPGRVPGDSIGAGGGKGRTGRSPHFRTCRSVSRSPFGPARSSCPSSGVVSSAASRKSVSRPKCRLSSRFARNRTSSDSISSSMPRGLVSIVGTTTRVRDSGGIPSEKSIRGSGYGFTSSVASQLTSATASRLAQSRERAPNRASGQPRSPSACAFASKGPGDAGRQTARSSTGRGAGGTGPPSAEGSRGGAGAPPAARSSRGNPLSIR